MNMDSVKKRTSEDWLLFSSIGWRIFLAVAGSRTFTSNICSWHICAEQSLLVSFQSHNSLPILDWTGRDLGKGSQLAFSASRLTLCSLKKMRNSKVIQEKVFAQRPIMREYLHSIPDFVKWIFLNTLNGCKKKYLVGGRMVIRTDPYLQLIGTVCTMNYVHTSLILQTCNLKF